ncbi:MAG: Valyl-tRNA synthetase, partial [Spirochaeta sp.]|nr:Valyl-tRNA synthetase [Spirochaeta sp.]
MPKALHSLVEPSLFWYYGETLFPCRRHNVKAVELPKAYDPKQFEARIYQQWLEEGKFKPAEGKEPPFTIVMPPPNVTGILHMGHALNNSLQ